MTRFETLYIVTLSHIFPFGYIVHIYLNTSRIILIAPYSGSVPSLIKNGCFVFSLLFFTAFQKGNLQKLAKMFHPTQLSKEHQ